ncbi:MAG: flagellar FlbD family protein [Deltaproteobacteria bacterium]|nr:flagellar FlbD family protein [Deltaproteobacteria bacterium]
MIKLTRLNKSTLVVNSDLIEFMEVTPDTVITLITGEKIMVAEGIDDIISRIIAFRRATGGRYPHTNAFRALSDPQAPSDYEDLERARVQDPRGDD